MLILFAMSFRPSVNAFVHFMLSPAGEDMPTASAEPLVCETVVFDAFCFVAEPFAGDQESHTIGVGEVLRVEVLRVGIHSSLYM